jgi:site-specific recombinase XerD
MSWDTGLARFEQALIKQDLAKTTIKGYLGDLRLFCRWLDNIHAEAIDLGAVEIADLRAYRQYFVKQQRQKPTAVNRRLQALRRFFAWAKG